LEAQAVLIGGPWVGDLTGPAACFMAARYLSAWNGVRWWPNRRPVGAGRRSERRLRLDSVLA